MPIPTTAKLFKPKSEDEFEEISVDFLRIHWSDRHANRNGRRGQGQHGIDIIGHPPWLRGRTAGAQCRNKERITLPEVVTSVDDTDGFEGGIGEFLLLTSADRDAPLQSAVRKHFRENPTGFDVQVIFWQDITSVLAGDVDLIKKHWPHYFASGPKESPGLQDPEIQAALLAIQREAQRMKERSYSVNAGLHHRHHDIVERVGEMFRPERLEALYRDVLPAIATRELLASSVDELIAVTGAADGDAERLLAAHRSRRATDAHVSDFLRRIRRVGDCAHQVLLHVGQALRQAPPAVRA